MCRRPQYDIESIKVRACYVKGYEELFSGTFRLVQSMDQPLVNYEWKSPGHRVSNSYLTNLITIFQSL